jgi:hypothetical protein
MAVLQNSFRICQDNHPPLQQDAEEALSCGLWASRQDRMKLPSHEKGHADMEENIRGAFNK